MPTKSLLPRFSFIFVALISTAIVSADTAEIAKHERWITSAAFSPDGKILATGGGQSLQYRPGDIILWDATSGAKVGELKGHEANVWSISFSADSSRLASSSYKGKVIIWDLAAKKAVATIDKYKSWVRSVAIGGDKVAAGGEDGTVTIFALADGKEVKSIKAHETQVTDVALSADGKTLATASTDKTSKLFDVDAGTEKAKLEGHTEAIWSVAFSPDGSQIATSGADRSIILWGADGKKQAALYGHKNWVTNVAYSNDGKSLASSSLDWSVKKWDLAAATQLAGQVEAAVAKVAETRKTIDDSAQAAADAQKESDAAKSKAEAVASIVTSKEAAEKLKQAQAALDGDKENADKKKAVDDAKKASDEATKAMDAKIKAFAADKEFTATLNTLKGGELPAVVAERDKQATAVDAAVAKVAEANGKKTAAEKALDGVLAQRQKLYDQQSTTLTGHKSTVWTTAFSPDGKTLVSGSHRVGAESGTNTIRVWNLANKSEVFPAPQEESKEEPKEGE